MTVDFEVPRGVDGAHRAATHLPLVLLRKVPPVLNIDLRDEDDRTLPLLSKTENAVLSARAFIASLEHAFDRRMTLEVQEAAFRLAGAQPAQAYQALRDLAEMLRRFPEPQEPHRYRRRLRVRRVMQLARSMVGNSLIWVPISDAPGSRRVVKFAYEEPLEVLSSLPLRVGIFLGFRSLHAYFATPHLRGCRSYHFEASVPRDLELHDARLHAEIRDASDPTEVRGVELVKAYRRDLHLYVDLAWTQTLASDGVSFKVRPGRRGFLSFGLSAGLLIAAMLWTTFLLRGQLVTSAASQAIPPVLVLIPAVLVALVNRPEEHPFSAFLLTGTRYLILLSGVVASAAAGVLAFVSDPADSTALGVAWGIAAGLTALIAILLLIGWIASLPRRARALSWALVSLVLMAGYLLCAAMSHYWGSITILVVVIVGVALVLCLRIAAEGRPDPPREERYFESDLRAHDVLPSTTR